MPETMCRAESCCTGEDQDGLKSSQAGRLVGLSLANLQMGQMPGNS